ncbi:hypothetical protein AAMO2058_001708000 [Amorphochlora amoebiformis]
MLKTAALAAMAAVIPYVLSPVHTVNIESFPLGVLERNTLLDGAEHLFQGDVVGPEAFTVEEDGSLITGLADGRIVRISSTEDGGVLSTTLARTGVNDSECGSSIELEPRCGRPLGMHLDPLNPNKLFIVDGYKGFLEMDLKTNQITTLATHTEDGSPLVLPNSVLPSSDGLIIYITDTSVTYQRRRIFHAAFSGIPTGRLLAYHRSNGSISIIREGLLMPNGMAHDYHRKCFLIALTISREVKRYCPHDNTLTTFAKGLPGTLDNIVRYSDPYTHERGFLLGIGSKVAKPFSLLTAIAPFPSLRRWLCGLPLPYTWLYKLIPKHGILGVLDTDGNLVTTLQDPTGYTSWVSEGVVSNGSLWLGSWLSPHLTRVPFGKTSPARLNVVNALR